MAKNINLVSILMPVKNADPFLVDCLNSILDQTHTNWELITVDDHSSDQSRKILDDFSESDSRIKVLENTGSGIISALNTAYSIAKGEFITRMDADDLMVPEKLEKMVNVLSKSNEKTIVTGLVKYFSDQPISEGYLKYENWLNVLNLSGNQWSQTYRECVIASPNWLIHRNSIDEIGGFDQLSYPEDYHMVLKWYQQGLEIRVVPEVTLQWREHPTRTSRLSENYHQEAFFRLKINHFIQHEMKKGDLLLWGNNEKTKLTGKILTESKISFELLDLSNYGETANFDQPQILVGVYPEPTERKKIENYLAELSLQEGIDWWYI